MGRINETMITKKAQQFFHWLHNNNNNNPEQQSILQAHNNTLTRTTVGELFSKFHQSEQQQLLAALEELKITTNHTKKSKPKSRNLEGRTMFSLRQSKLMKSRRYDHTVICTFANPDGRSFPPVEERVGEREKLKKARRGLRLNKGGVGVSGEPRVVIVDGGGGEYSVEDVLPLNEEIRIWFDMHQDQGGDDDDGRDDRKMELYDVRVSGTHGRHFVRGNIQQQQLPMRLLGKTTEGECSAQFTFRTCRIAAHRATFAFSFRRINNSITDEKKERISILRDVVLRSGDADIYKALGPTTPYVKKKRHDKNEQRVDRKDIVHPPTDGRSRGGSGGYKGLGQFPIPKHTRRRMETGELEDALVKPWDYENNEEEEEFGTTYRTFWQNLLWISEVQAYDDIRFFDLTNASLQKHNNSGRLFKLYVSGLAEGRPSVLRGDIVLCLWNKKEYRGRVTATEQLDVLLEFHPSFHRSFDERLDRVERVRFSFQRTNFRTAHAGIEKAVDRMGVGMLLPSKGTVRGIVETRRDCPERWRWTSDRLNGEQKQAVEEIVQGRLRPLPYIIFGPPGTGKTTTLVEAIYQLANLRNNKLKILVVAPSNDATDILVEKLSPYFPSSEMLRVLAYTRSTDDVPEAVRKYCTKNGEESVISKILTKQITVCTINMASRLWCTGGGSRLPKNHFDVVCVDEAGHATEPEVIAVASTIMDFTSGNHQGGGGQLVLAGDPMQLGPIVTSTLCQKFQMDRSYMERLIQTSPAYNLENNNDRYPPGLVTLLVKNYRSHHHILKLPNEMFYHNQLIARGDTFQTSSLTNWEHLPTKGFPVLFHAVDGENTREGTSPSWFNPQEAMIVVEYVRKLVAESKPTIAHNDIGIITPYARQVQKIRTALRVSNIDDVKVGSVETFQGQERRVIIISTVRSENSLLQHDLRYNLGFVANEKRFNVALTRAKALLIVVGNPRVLETDTKNWLPFLRFCKSQKSWLGEDWNEGETASRDIDDEEVEDDAVASALEGEDGYETVDKDEWVVAAQEGYCFVNREE